VQIEDEYEEPVVWQEGWFGCERMLNFASDGLSISSDGFVVEFTRTVPNTDGDLDQQFLEVSRRLYDSSCLVKRLNF
jgi:hypothetical protein